MKSRRWHRAFAALGGLVVGLSVLAAISLVRIGTSSQLRDLQAQIQEIRESGEPIEPKDLTQFCPISDAEKARAAQWMRLATLAEPTGKFTDDAKPLPFVGELEVKDDALDDASAEELRAKARAFLAKHQAPLRLVHELGKSPGPVAFPYKFEDGFDARFPWVQSLRALNRLLAMECRLRAIEGDIVGSYESWNTMLALSESLRPRPCGVSCGVVEAMRHSMLRLAIEQIQFQLNHCTLSDGQLHAIHARLTEIRPENDIRRVMLGERMIGLLAFQHPDQLFGSDAPKLKPEASLAANAGDCLFFFHTIHDLIATCELPYPECRRQAKRQLDAALEKGRPIEPSQTGEFPGSALMLPGATILSIEGAAPTIALRNIALTAVACRRFAQIENRFPNALDDLIHTYLDAVPNDPYAVEPLKAKMVKGDIAIYSVGKNETDDGGLNDFEFGDIAWVVLRSKQ